MGAEAADNELALTDDTLAECACGRAGNGVPLDVFDAAAAVADEVMMQLVLGVVTRGAAFGGNLADEAGVNEVAEIVIDGGARRARVEAIYGLEDFRGGGVLMVVHEERHDAVTLRGAAQAAVFESLTDCLGVHTVT